MASAKDQVICHVCGFKNAAESERCVSCGAKLEELSGAYSAEEEARKRGQQEGFAIKWAAVAFAIYLVLPAIVLALLPLVISSYDPQGFSALMIALGLWFVGGVIVGWLSPGKTFIEPAVGALSAVIPTIWYIVAITPEGFELSMTAYVIGGLLGGMMALFGAFIGEKIQGNPKPRAQS